MTAAQRALQETRSSTKRTGQQDRTGQDRTGQDRTGQDRTGQDRTVSKITARKQSSGPAPLRSLQRSVVSFRAPRRTKPRPPPRFRPVWGPFCAAQVLWREDGHLRQFQLTAQSWRLFQQNDCSQARREPDWRELWRVSPMKGEKDHDREKHQKKIYHSGGDSVRSRVDGHAGLFFGGLHRSQYRQNSRWLWNCHNSASRQHRY